MKLSGEPWERGAQRRDWGSAPDPGVCTPPGCRDRGGGRERGPAGSIRSGCGALSSVARLDGHSLPVRSGAGGGGRSAVGETVALGDAGEAAQGGECGESVVEGGVADVASGAQVGDGQWAAGGGERGRDAFVHRGGRRLGRGVAVDDGEGQRVAALCKLERDGGQRRGGAVFNGEGEVIALAAQVHALAQDLPRVWKAPTTTDRERKELLRYAISEVQLDGVGTPGKIEIRITWRSGAVTVRTVERLPVGSWAPRTAQAVVERIRTLAPDLTAGEIADRLDREGLRSAHGKPLREHHVLYICRSRGIPVHCSPVYTKQEGRSHLNLT